MLSLAGVESLIGMEGMDIGNKILIFIALGLSFSFALSAQRINCYESVNFYKRADLNKAIADYVMEDPMPNHLILVDFTEKDSISIFRIVGSLQVFEMLYKKPDCYFIHKNNMVYLYTDSYAQDKNALWLECVFQKTRELLNYKDIAISWKNDSILEIEGSFILSSEYSPVITEYHVCNGKILSKSYRCKMFYPDISEPKGVKIFR